MITSPPIRTARRGRVQRLPAAELTSTSLQLCIVGVPPHLRGSAHAPADLDIRLLSASHIMDCRPELRIETELFPQVKRWLVEKPISALPYSAAAGQVQVLDLYAKSGTIVGVGYHFAALKAVMHLQRIIKQKNLRVMATQARYNMAYVYAAKPAWWNQDISCGREYPGNVHTRTLLISFS